MSMLVGNIPHASTGGCNALLPPRLCKMSFLFMFLFFLPFLLVCHSHAPTCDSGIGSRVTRRWTAWRKNYHSDPRNHALFNSKKMSITSKKNSSCVVTLRLHFVTAGKLRTSSRHIEKILWGQAIFRAILGYGYNGGPLGRFQGERCRRHHKRWPKMRPVSRQRQIWTLAFSSIWLPWIESICGPRLHHKGGHYTLHARQGQHEAKHDSMLTISEGIPCFTALMKWKESNTQARQTEAQFAHENRIP